jgi:hypothetical protein
VILKYKLKKNNFKTENFDQTPAESVTQTNNCNTSISIEREEERETVARKKFLSPLHKVSRKKVK